MAQVMIIKMADKYIHALCESGISGNMTIGALLHMGLPFEHLEKELAKLGLSNHYELICEKQTKHDVEGIYFNVRLLHDHHEHHHDQHAQHQDHHAHHKDHHNHHRGFYEIKNIIEASHLSSWVKEKAVNAFYELGIAEAKVHETTLEAVHFHEVGAIDCIVDIVGTMIGLDYFGVEGWTVSSIRTGYGTVHCAHGEMEIPTPATANLLGGFDIYPGDVRGELVTPTGAALVRSLVTEKTHQGQVIREGIGLGTMDLSIPNVLKLQLIG